MNARTILRRGRPVLRGCLATLQIATLLATTSSCGGLAGLAGAPGRPQYQERLILPVPGGHVNLAGGNLLVRRTDLVVDTRLGVEEIGATYNGWLHAWRWSFDLRYDGATFIDASRATYDTSGLVAGDAIPGSTWVFVDASTLKTKGGLVHEFDADGLLHRVRWSSSTHPRIEYTSALVAGEPRITAVQQCGFYDACSIVHTVEYDAAGRVSGLEDGAGRRAEFTYDGSGHLVTARDALDRSKGWPGFRYEYSADGRLTAVTTSEGERVEYGYERSRVNHVSRVGPGTPTWSFHYGRDATTGAYFTRVFDPLGFESVHRYDAERRLLEAENPLGEVTRYTWSGLRPASRTDAAGLTTSWTWANDDVASEVQPSGRTLQYVRDAGAVDRLRPGATPLVSISDQLGPIETHSYSSSGRLASVANGAGEVTLYSYDADEQLSGVTDPAGVTVTFSAYGEHGHPTKLGVLSAFGPLLRDQLYDAVGNLVSGDALASELEPGRPGIAARQFDEDRNVVRVELAPSGATPPTIDLEVRSDGQRTRILRPYGGETEFGHDAFGRVVTRRDRVDGTWRETRFEYDALGRRTAVERPNGMRSEVEYDAAGRVRVRRDLRDGVVEQTLVVTRVDGRVTALLDSVHGAVEQIAYDSAGRPSAVTFPTSETLEVDHDLRSREVAVRYRMPDGSLLRTITADWDAADRIVRVSEDSVALVERTIESGRLVSVRYGNGLERTLSWDTYSGELVGATLRDAASATLESTLLERAPCMLDSLVCLTARTETFGSLPAVTEQRYWLEPFSPSGPDVGRRATAFGSVAAPAPWHELPERDLRYDELGNLQSHQDFAQPFAFNAEHNRLLAADGHGYAYDEAGFTTQRDGESLEWTAAGRIAAIGSGKGFVWDTLGRPVSSQVDGVVTRFLFGGRVQADASLEPQRLDLGEVEIRIAEGDHRYRHRDFRGNVKLVSNGAGEIVRHIGYGPYAVEIVHGNDDDDVGFAGGRELGDLVVLGVRLYDPAAGRFLSPDPIPQVIGQFAYAAGNPVEWWDPDGRQPTPSGFTPQQAAVVAAGMAITNLGTSVVQAGILTANVPVVVIGATLIVVGVGTMYIGFVGLGDLGG